MGVFRMTRLGETEGPVERHHFAKGEGRKEAGVGDSVKSRIYAKRKLRDRASSENFA